jgi:hypothetical protein
MSCPTCGQNTCTECGACAKPTTVVTIPPCAPMSFCAGNYTITFDGQCLTKTRRANAIPDGTYKNADVSIEDGCITALSEGTPSSTVLAGPCTTTPGGGIGTTPTIATGSCNLLSDTGSGLQARAVLVAYPPLSVTGCGSAAQPWVMEFDGASIGGVDVDSCGYKATGGIFTQWVDPVTNVINGDGSLLISKTGCSIQINSAATYTQKIIYSRPLCCTDTTGVPRFLGMGTVNAAVIDTAPWNDSAASIGFCWNSTTVPPAFVPPPALFSTRALAIAWLDALTFSSCPTNIGGGVDGGP